MKRLQTSIALLLVLAITLSQMPICAYATESNIASEEIIDVEFEEAMYLNDTGSSMSETTIPSPSPLRDPKQVVGEGDGSAEKPFRIDSEEDFVAIKQNPNAHYIVTSSFSVSTNICDTFTGVLDGNHYTITVCGSALHDGLFSDNSGTVKNINLFVNGYIYPKEGNARDIGFICSENNGVIQDCTVQGTCTISASSTYSRISFGVITGYNHGVIERCWNDANINSTAVRAGEFNVGGIAGSTSSRGQISECLNTGVINVQFKEDHVMLMASYYFYFYVGGIAGNSLYSRITSSINAAPITCSSYLAGNQYSMFAGKYDLNFGFISGGEYPHGTSLHTNTGKVENCYIRECSELNINLQTYGGRYFYESFHYSDSDTTYATLDDIEIIDWWENLERPDLDNSQDVEEEYLENVLYFRKWDNEQQIAYWGTEESNIESLDLCSQATEETDMAFLKDVDSLVGTYVLVTTKPRDNGMIAADVLLSIKPLETKTGTVTAIDETTITLDGIRYTITDRIAPVLFDVGDTVMYHLYNGELVGIFSYSISDEDGDNGEPINNYRLVVTPNENITVELGSKLIINCNLFFGNESITDWKAPSLSIKQNATECSIRYDGYEKAWTGGYDFSFTCSQEGNVILSFSDSEHSLTVDIEVEIIPIDESLHHSQANLEWITDHIKFAGSSSYSSLITQGFTGNLNDALEEIKANGEIKAYKTLDSVNKILGFDIGGINDSQEYELLLAQIFFSTTGSTSIEETYYEYLTDAVFDLGDAALSVGKKMGFSNDYFDGLNKILELPSNNQTPGGSDFLSLVNDLLGFIEQYESPDFIEGLIDNCKQTSQWKFLGKVSADYLKHTYSSFKEIFMYLAVGEAYSKTSDAFSELLLEMRRHIGVGSNNSLFTPYGAIVTNDKIWSILDIERPNDYLTPNPLNTPIVLSDLAKAIEDFYTCIQTYKHDDAMAVAADIVVDALDKGGDVLLRSCADMAVSLFDYLPVLREFAALREALSTTQKIVDMFTGIDDRTKLGTMVMRLYCIEYIHYLTLDNLASSSWTTLPSNAASSLEEFQMNKASMFDEAVTFYKSVQSLAIEYACAYYKTYLDSIWISPTQKQHTSKTSFKIMELRKQNMQISNIKCHDENLNLNPGVGYVTIDNSGFAIYTVKCPVTVFVKNEAGELIAELNGYNDNIKPGYEIYFYTAEVDADTGEYVKMLLVPKSFKITLKGTDNGTMNAAWLDYSDGVQVANRFFVDVPISENIEGNFVNGTENPEIKELIIDGTTLAGEDESELTEPPHEHVYTPVVTPPICIEKGYTTHTCACGDSYIDTFIDPTGHIEVVDAAKEATCTKTGLTEGKHCSVCTKVLVKQEAVPVKEHTEVVDAGKKATCEEAGLTEGKHCSVCNKVLVKQETVPAKGHTEVIDAAKEATCTKTGLTEGKHCSICNKVLVKQEVVPVKAHTEVVDAGKKATCEEAGLTDGKHCSVCNAVLIEQTAIPALGHKTNSTNSKEATCTEDGYTGDGVCTVCNKTLESGTVIPAKGHIEVKDAAKAPTCTETGLTEGKHCSVCNKVLVKQEVVPSTGHSEVVDAAKEATCMEAGLTEGKHCSTCNKVLTKQEAVPVKAHTEVADTGKKATCEEAGLTDGKHCSACNTVLVEQTTVPALGHKTNSTNAKEATCTEDGYTGDGVCTVCNKTLVAGQVIPAKGHTEVKDAAKNPTCTETGLTESKHCSVCNKVLVKQEVIPAAGHTEGVDTAKEATCTETGLTEGKHCSVCNTVLVKQEVIPVVEHTWDSGKVTKEPTAEEDGIKTFTCTVCGETKKEPIPKTDPEPTPNPEPTPDPEPPVTKSEIINVWTTDLTLSAADLGVDAPDAVLRATLTFNEDGTSSTTWKAIDLTALRMFFHDMFVNSYYAMAYGAGITDIQEIERFCVDSTGMSVSAYMDTIVTPEAIEAAFTPASTSGSYKLSDDQSAMYTDMAIMDVQSNPEIANSFVIGDGTMYLNAASYGKTEYTFVCTKIS